MKGFLTAIVLVAFHSTINAFVPSTNCHQNKQFTPSTLFAKKKGGSGQGFSKQSETPSPPTSQSETLDNDASSPSPESKQEEAAFLQSVQGGSTSMPVEEELSPEDRAKLLLRDKYGLKTLEEERMTQKQREQLKAQRERMADLKARASAGEDLDLISMIPGPVIQAIYKVLQAGIAVTGTAFILSGVFITLEAWSRTSGEPLPENIDSFIVNTVEPYFTPMLLVLLGFSVSLGVLAALQLSSKSATYKEE